MTERRGTRGTPPDRPPLWLWIAAASFALYFLLLVVGNALRPAPNGLLVRFDQQGVTAADVRAGSPAALAGVRAGDRIESYQGRAVRRRLDWFAIDANIAPGEVVTLHLARAEGAVRVTIPPDGWFVRVPPRRETVSLAIALAGQLLTLLLAALVAFRRPRQPLAQLGAWLLASLGVFTFVLPFGFAHLWRIVPGPVQWLLWLPFLSSVAGGMLFFAFCAEFPRRALRPAATAAACAPGLVPLAWHAYYGDVMIRQAARAPLAVDTSWVLLAANGAYFAAGLALLLWQYRRLDGVVERRRLRVLLAGTGAGCASGLLIGVQFWVRPTPELTGSLFASPLTLVGVPLALCVPGAIAYTILRHRLFDVSLIVRQGVRYALARRVLLSLAPVLALALTADLVLHGQEPLFDLLRARAWRYATVAALLVAVLTNRDRWLEALDRRFFRSRYRAGQILRDVAQQLRNATDPPQAMSAVVREVDRALQPWLVAAIERRADEAPYHVVAAIPGGAVDPPPLTRDSRIVALARLVEKPLDLSPDQDTWIASHLPDEEAGRLAASRIELVVPVAAGPERDVLIVLGPRRSEEPYAAEDLELLDVIATSLGLLLGRVPPGAASEAAMAECPVCGACLDTSVARCPSDHALLAVSDLPPVLDGRYRLVARIGAGGMGTVYHGHDTLLNRAVAIKVVAEALVGSTEAATRFRQEAQAAAAFAHSHVVTIHDAGVTAGGRPFLVMERLEGRTLRARLSAEGPLGAPETVQVVTDVCDVLDAAHGRGLVHRDLKPENVFLARADGGEITKVLDFGIAKVLRSQAAGVVETRRGVIVGSLPYMSPEQLRGEPTTAACDLWALAVMTHEMLTGAYPPNVAWADEDGRRPAAGPPAALPQAVEGFFAAALAEDPDMRPRTARELRDALVATLQPA